MVASPTPGSEATASMVSAPYPTSASSRRIAARMTPSRLGSRGRPPRLERGPSVMVRTGMIQTLDTKDSGVPELRPRRTARHPEVAVQAAVQPAVQPTAVPAARLARGGGTVSHPAGVGIICGGVCGCRQNWEMPGPATRVLLATSIGHVLPTVARLARGMGLTVYSSPQLL